MRTKQCHPVGYPMSTIKTGFLRKPLSASISAKRMLATGYMGLAAGMAGLLPVPATFAQDDPRIEEIAITGSRISRDGYDSPTPVSVLNADEIEAVAPSNIADFVNTLPSVQGIQSASSNSGSLSNGQAGIAALNLRALGQNRTLVLLDGQRSVTSAATGLVDINTFPQALISRVEVVTGGASSAYGSDAVGGVVNFVLDRTFEGLKTDYQYGETTYGDMPNHRFTLTGGTRFGGGRGHAMFSTEYFTQDGILTIDRPWNDDGFYKIQNPNYSPSNGEPWFHVGRGIGPSLYTPGGLVTNGPLRGTYFGRINPQTGEPVVNQLVYGEVSGPWMIGGDYRITREGHHNSNSLSSDEDRRLYFGRVSWELTPNIELFAQASLSRWSGFSYYQVTPNTGNVTIRSDNAFLPASVRDEMQSLGLASFAMGTSNNGIPAAGASNTREVTRYVVGGNGGFEMLGRAWDWDAYYQRGQAETDELLHGTWNNARMNAATDAVFHPDTGQIVCRSSIANPGNGCVPINRIGIGGVTPEALGYVFGAGDPYRDQKLTQDVAAFNISTNDLFDTWAGPVSFATGAEWRREAITGNVDPIYESGWLYGNYRVTEGSYTVAEAYVEAVVPLASTLDFNGAYRLTDYELSGTVNTWKAGLTWQPIDDLRFRVTQSHDIRAPNLAELFAAGTARTNTVNLFPTMQASQFLENTSGNLALTPEKADSTGIGVVVMPRFLPDVTFSVDYYNITMSDNIGTVNAQNTADLCLEQGIQAFCPNLIFNSAGVLQQINLNPVNFASLKAKGFDMEATYRTSIGLGDLTLRAMATRYITNINDNGIDVPTNGAGANMLGLAAGGTGLPSWNYRLSGSYTIDQWSMNLIGRGFSSGVYDTNWIECSANCPTSTIENRTINDNSLPGAFYLDASLIYNFEIGNAQAQALFFVQNIANKDPGPAAIGPTGNNSPSYPSTNRTLYDVFGRVMRVGMKVNF